MKNIINKITKNVILPLAVTGLFFSGCGNKEFTGVVKETKNVGYGYSGQMIEGKDNDYVCAIIDKRSFAKGDSIKIEYKDVKLPTVFGTESLKTLTVPYQYQEKGSVKGKDVDVVEVKSYEILN